MSIVLPRQAIDAVAHSADPKAEMLKKIGNELNAIHPMYNIVLVATYIRPGMTKGGIIRPDENIEEDVWQGKVGLVLKMGKAAFVDDVNFSFNGERADPGDWVGYKVGDGWSVTVGEWPCRMIRDSNIQMKLDDPLCVK